MDKLDRYQEELERRHAFFAKPEPEAPRSDIRAADYPVTIIGCVRGIDGWYRAGFDHAKNAVMPMERIEKISQQYVFECSECRVNGWEGLRICHKHTCSDTFPGEDTLCPYSVAPPNWKLIGTYPETKTTMKAAKRRKQ